jgi:spermidine synthase
MTPAKRLFLPAALVVFTASGFAGLIYESVWSHYLKLFLGHAAYAQSLVLMIFMGGMALGAWGASRISPRLRNLLLAYALIEAVIGLAALVFHPVFVAVTGFAFDEIFPALGAPLAVHALKWSLAAALILPQSVLLGMTFPLMTAGVLRVHPQRSGYAIAMLYFTNSLGAAVGVLASAFYFIPAVGLPGTLAAAGVLNLAVAAAAILLPGRTAVSTEAATSVAPSAPVSQLRVLLVVAALTGMSSFMYEIGWIRMLALVLGSSTHAFELMLSAFIVGIAFGGLWVRRRIDTAADTVRLLAWVQIAMGIAALATLPVYGSTFHAMETVLGALQRSQTAYAAFNIMSHGLCLAIMFPAAFCAGMTLPLITAALLRCGAGERAIGQVYAANTAGAIIGVVLAVHLGFTLLGLKGLIVAGAAIDLALGVALLWNAPRQAVARSRFAMPFATALAALALATSGLFVELDAHLMSSGVFRNGTLLHESHRVHAQLHGKTATISVTGGSQSISVRTNGKVDGSVRIDGEAPVTDEITMTFAGALPLILAPQARRVANIGFGTGMTTHVLLASPTIEQVDTIEIEPAMVKAGEHLRRVNWRALDDPRSRFHYEDAKTYFAAHNSRYDIIISEPSNPWVSGVATLFSVEFYRDVRRYLQPGGLFVQWVQLYETTPQLLATVVAALEGNFSDYEFWLANDNDLLIVASHEGTVPSPHARAFENPALRAELERFRIANLDDLALHRVGGRATLMPYFASFGVEPNSDYFPVLEMKAPLARYMQKHAPEVRVLTQAPLPLFALFDSRAQQPDPARVTRGERPWLQRAGWVRQADDIRQYLRPGSDKLLAPFNVELTSDLVLIRAALVDCKLVLPEGTLPHHLADLARYVSTHLPSRTAVSFWDQLGIERCGARLSAADRQWLRLHRAVAAADAANMMRAGEAILEDEPQLDVRLRTHALAVFMAGALLTEKRAAALTAFNKHRGRLGNAGEWEPVFRFLIGQADWSVTKIDVTDKNGHHGDRSP